MDVRMFIPMLPRGKAAAKANGHGGLRKDPTTREYEAALTRAIIARWPGDVVWSGAPLALDLLFVFPHPRAIRSRNRHAVRCCWAPVKPDWDNLVKGTQDALLGKAARESLLVALEGGPAAGPCALPDDCWVVLGRVAKVHAGPTEPHKLGTYVRLYEAEEMPEWAQELYNMDPAGEVLDQEIP